MNPSPELNTILKQLRLSGILDSLEQRNREAIAGQLAYTDFLAMLLHDEIARRDTKKLGARLARAGFAMGKTLVLRFTISGSGRKVGEHTVQHRTAAGDLKCGKRFMKQCSNLPSSNSTRV
jgi:hypothetical protein